MAEKDVFRMNEVAYSDLTWKVTEADMLYSSVKKKAEKFNVNSVRDLFTELCAEHKTIVSLPFYLDEYMKRVEEALEEKEEIQDLSEEHIDVYRNIMKLRGFGSYRSNLCELSFKLMCRNLLNDEYEIVAHDNKCDRILGVDLILLSRKDNIAHYVHVTKDNNFSTDLLKKKERKQVTVHDERAVDFLNEEGITQYRRRFKNHVLALYDDQGRNNDIINGVYIFKEEYIREILQENYGKCDKSQYDELQYLERSKKQIFTRGNVTITVYEE